MDNTQKLGWWPRIGLQRAIFALLLALLLALGTATLILASDVSNAQWQGLITVSNNGTATSAVSVNMSLNSASLIANGYAASNLTDIAVQLNGADTAFMPAANTTYPWILFVPNIGAGQNVNYDIYTGGASGGTLRYFPGASGMTTADSASLEGGDNFTLEQVVWVDTTAVGANLTDKNDAFRLYVGGSGNITASIESNTPTGHTDYDGNWINETYAYDRNEASYAYRPNIGTTSWSGYLGFDRTSNPCSAVRYMAGGETSNINQIDVDVYYDGGWHGVYQGAFTQGVWETKAISSSSNITEARVRLYNEHGANSYDGYIYEFEFISSISATATSVSSGEHTVRTWADTSYLHISIDGAESDNTSLSGFSVPNNGSSWNFMQGIDYMERSRIWVDGVLQQDIIWEYTTTFSDQSGNNHDATPTFRTASSDADVSAVLSSFGPAEEAQLSTFTLVSEYEILTGNASLISAGTYTELDVSKIPGGEAANELLAEGGVPQAAWWYPFLFLGICVVGLIVYGATTLNRSGLRGRLVEGQVDGSLLIMFVIMEAALTMLGIMGVIPKWPFMIFPIAGIAIILSRKHYSWG